MHNAVDVASSFCAISSARHVVASDKRVFICAKCSESLGNIGSRLAGYLATHPSARWELCSSFSLRATDTSGVAPAPSWRHAVSRGHPVLTIGTHLPSSSNRMAPVWSTLFLRMHSYVACVVISLRFFKIHIAGRDFSAFAVPGRQLYHDRRLWRKWQWH